MPAPQAIVHQPRVWQQVVELVAWAEDRLEEGSGHPLLVGVPRLQPCESEGFMVGQAWVNDAQSPSLDRLDTVSLLPSQPGVPHSTGVLHGTAHVCLVEGGKVSAGCACSPEHAHKVQSPVGVGTDVVDMCSPREIVGDHDPQHLCTADPFQLTALDLQWGDVRVWVFLGEGDNHLLGLVHIELHLVALRPLSAVIGNVLQAGVSAGDVAALPGGSVIHKLHSAAALQQVIDHEQEDDGANMSSLGHTSIHRQPVADALLHPHSLLPAMQESAHPRHDEFQKSQLPQFSQQDMVVD